MAETLMSLGIITPAAAAALVPQAQMRPQMAAGTAAPAGKHSMACIMPAAAEEEYMVPLQEALKRPDRAEPAAVVKPAP